MPRSLLPLLSFFALGCRPASVFEQFWTALDEDYALFDLRLDPEESWDEVGERYRQQLAEDGSRDELFDLLIAMARELDDGHVTLRSLTLDRDEDGQVEPYPYMDEMHSLAALIDDDRLQAGPAVTANDALYWGTIDGVGYLRIELMERLCWYGSESGDEAAAHDAMAEVLEDLGDVSGLVVDLRVNDGGWDAVSLALAGHFASERTLAWTECTRDGPSHDDCSAWEEAWIEPAEPRYDGPVVVLTSGGTFSAAETFALAMRALPGVSLVGERSSGHFSDMLEGRLSNGWRYTLSNERYRAADGEIYETLGVSVDVEIPYDPDFVGDAMLDEALALLDGV